MMVMSWRTTDPYDRDVIEDKGPLCLHHRKTKDPYVGDVMEDKGPL